MNQKILNERDYFKSSDLALVAALSLFFSIEAIDKDISGKAYFLFLKNSEGFDETLQRYWSRQLKVEPQTFFNQLKVVKARIFSER